MGEWTRKRPLLALVAFYQQRCTSISLRVARSTGLSALAELQLAGALMLFPGAVVFALATGFVMRDE